VCRALKLPKLEEPKGRRSEESKDQRFEEPKGQSPEVDKSRRFEGGHVAPNLELRRKAKGENVETPKYISIID
jgi:hypothetical protein